jgi:haloalkane dehalogenase
MGGSGPSSNGSYTFVDHARYLDAWFDAMNLTQNVTLVGHDWGSALGFHWACRHSDRIKALAYMEGFVRPVTWDEWPDAATQVFEGMRSDAGETMILQKNVFIENILPGSILRKLTDEEMNVYRKPFPQPGERRRPMLTWPRQVSIDGDPADVTEIVDAYSKWLAASDLPKLFINAKPGAILTGPQREFCRAFPNQKEVTVKGIHFIHEIGQAIADFLKNL